MIVKQKVGHSADTTADAGVTPRSEKMNGPAEAGPIFRSVHNRVLGRLAVRRRYPVADNQAIDTGRDMNLSAIADIASEEHLC